MHERLPACVESVPCLCIAHRSQKRALRPPELELQMVVSHHINAGNWIQMSVRDLPTFFTFFEAISLAPLQSFVLMQLGRKYQSTFHIAKPNITSQSVCYHQEECVSSLHMTTIKFRIHWFEAGDSKAQAASLVLSHVSFQSVFPDRPPSTTKQIQARTHDSTFSNTFLTHRSTSSRSVPVSPGWAMKLQSCSPVQHLSLHSLLMLGFWASLPPHLCPRIIALSLRLLQMSSVSQTNLFLKQLPPHP